VTPIGGVQLIKVRTLSGRTARYQFKVFPVNRRPESVDSRFAFGDSVTDEAIDPIVDADVFYALPWAVADTGAYRFMLYRINRRPEVRLANVQVGDTVVGESIDPAGDIDEFTLFAPPGDTLTSWFRLTGAPVPGVTYMSFQVYDRITQALLVQTLAYTTGPFAQGATFVVPPSGDVQIRISRFAGEASSAPYEFFFGPPPTIP